MDGACEEAREHKRELPSYHLPSLDSCIEQESLTGLVNFYYPVHYERKKKHSSYPLYLVDTLCHLKQTNSNFF